MKVSIETGQDLDLVLDWPTEKLKWYDLYFFGPEQPQFARASDLV